MNKKFIPFLSLIFLFIVCLNNKDTQWDSIKNDILTLNQYNLHSLLKKYNFKNSSELIIKDNSYYYPVAIYFYNKIGNSELTEYQLKYAIQTESIFKKEALLFIINKRIQDKSFEELKKVLKYYEKQLLNNDLHFFYDYLYDKKINEMTNPPEDKFYSDLIYDIVKNNRNDLIKKENIEKITNYIIKSKIYLENENNVTKQILDMVRWSKNDNFLSILYYYRIKQTSLFLRKVESLLYNNDNITYDKLSVVRELGVKLGLRKNIYYLFHKYYKKNVLITHFYGLDALKYEKFSTQMFLLRVIPYFREKNAVNYNLRYKNIIYNYKTVNEKWIGEVINFINDYPDKYYTKLLIDQLFQKVVISKKKNLLIDNVNKINKNLLPVSQKSILYYHLYLLDNDNDKWKKIITEECPFSFGSLTINNGKIDKNNLNQIKFDDFSASAKIIIKKINYLLEFNLLDEALKIKYDDLNNYEKMYINNILSDYHCKNEDYYTALKFSVKNLDYQNNDYYNIDNITLLEKAYPRHYKDLILKYSKIYNIEPALIFAVIREESNFKKDIKSHKNAMGLMQIIPSTGKFIASKLRIRHYNLKTPEDNIKMGVYYLNFLRNYHSKYEDILSSYNAGHSRTRQWLSTYRKYPEEILYELIPIYETRHYVKKVMRSYYIYKFLLEKDIENEKFTLKK
ncbi:MAG: lytic transglycosylase domain-containing protein [Spirochaetes bacterium]|nr:lytic transglycosylase domain-containing protein [Spirochaetota bacterium]